jgi:putative membrane protein
MNRMLAAVCCVALCSMPAPGKEKKAAAAATPAMSDQQFVDFAAQTDMVEANLGQLAGSTASAQAVKDYGQMLATDHTKDFHELYFAAHQANLNVPSAIDAEHNKAMIDPFQKLKGTAFDKRYIHEMIAGHTKAIAIYTKTGGETQNAALKTYAESALPVLQKHLDSARALEKGK